MARRVLSLSLALVLAVLLCACSLQQWHYEDLTITLPGDFQNRSGESYAEGLDFLYDDGTVAVAGARETRQDVIACFGQVDAQQYAQLVIELNGLGCQLTQKDGLWTFSYEATVGDTPLTYICVIHEAENSFWQLQAYCATADFEARQAAMWEYICTAKTDRVH